MALSPNNSMNYLGLAIVAFTRGFESPARIAGRCRCPLMLAIITFEISRGATPRAQNCESS
jgi:hypothetical protein